MEPKHPSCPACGRELRAFQHRLCCDACTGMLVSTDDLATVLAEHVMSQTGTRPLPGFRDGRLGARICPRCDARMITTHLDMKLGDKHHRLSPTLDRCAAHGVWFDANELAQILEAVQRAASLPSHASLRQILVTIFENYGHITFDTWRPLD
jgi:Zn-finger nucleic acid-binding protein